MQLVSMVQKTAPVLPPSAPLSGKHAEEFTQLKRQLNEQDSWELTPDSWDTIQIIYSGTGNEKQARSFITAIELSTPEM